METPSSFATATVALYSRRGSAMPLTFVLFTNRKNVHTCPSGHDRGDGGPKCKVQSGTLLLCPGLRFPFPRNARARVKLFTLRGNSAVFRGIHVPAYIRYLPVYSLV